MKIRFSLFLILACTSLHLLGQKLVVDPPALIHETDKKEINGAINQIRETHGMDVAIWVRDSFEVDISNENRELIKTILDVNLYLNEMLVLVDMSNKRAQVLIGRLDRFGSKVDVYQLNRNYLLSNFQETNSVSMGKALFWMLEGLDKELKLAQSVEAQIIEEDSSYGRDFWNFLYLLLPFLLLILASNFYRLATKNKDGNRLNLNSTYGMNTSVKIALCITLLFITGFFVFILF